MPEIKLKESDTGALIPDEDDDLTNRYLLGRQVAHEYHGTAVQTALDLTNQQELERQQAENQAAEAAAAYPGGIPGGREMEDQFARDMVGDMLKRRGKDGKSLYEREGEDRTEDFFYEQQGEKIMEDVQAELGGLEDPNFDPVMAGAGGFGAMGMLSINTAKALMPSLGRALTTGVVSAAGDIVPGVGMDVLEVKAPGLALPFGIAVSLLQGATVENAIERGIRKAATRAGQKITRDVVARKLTMGLVDDDVTRNVVDELNQGLTRAPDPVLEDPRPLKKFVQKNPQETAQLYAMGPGALAGFEEDEDGNWTFNPEKAIVGITLGAAATYGAARIGIETRGKGGRFLRGGQRVKNRDLDKVFKKQVTFVRPEWDQVQTMDEAIAFAAEIRWLDPEIVDTRQALRWRKSDEGYYGSDKMEFPNQAYPAGRNTWDMVGCGRERWAHENGIDVPMACYGAQCYAEVIQKKYGTGSVAGGEQFTTSMPKGLRPEVKAYFEKNGLEATREKYPDLVLEHYADTGNLSIKRQTYEAARPARVSTNLQPANGQDIRLGVDTDGSAWLADPRVMDAILAADPRTLTVYSSAYHKPPAPHKLSQRAIINVTVSGWHPLPETLARIRWAQQARENGWNVILREVVANPKQFSGDEAELYNRVHKAVMKTDFFVMQQPLHKGATHGDPMWKMPSCCVGSKANPRTCDHCEVAEGLGEGFQRYWNIGEEGGSEVVLPDSPYTGRPAGRMQRILKNERGEIKIEGGGEPTIDPKNPPQVGKSGIPAPPDMQKASDEFLANTNPDITQETAGNIRLWGGADLEPKFISEIETPEDINRVIAGTHEAFAAEAETARRGVRSWEETAEAAQQYNIEDLLGRNLGQALNAEQIDNARTLLVSSSETLKTMAAKVRSGQATDLEKMDFMRAFNTHYAIQMQLSGAAAEAGRALNIFRKVAQSDALRIGQIKDFLSAAGDANISPEKIAQGLSELDGPDQVAKFVKQARRATTWDMLMEAWINGLLSGPVTHAVNTTSNALVALYQIPERAAAWGFSKLLGDGAIQAGEVSAQTFGLVEGFKDGLKAGYKSLISGESADVTSKIEQQQYRAVTAENVKQLPAIKKLAPNALEQGGVAAYAVDALGEVVRLPGRFLTAEDDLFKSIGYRMELRAQAYRKAAAEGLSGDEAAKRIQEIIENPQEMAPDVHLAAIDAARYQTFTRELGEAGRAFQAAVNKSKVGRIIMPFIRTPANILKYTLERTGPLGLVMKSVRDDIAAGGARRDLALARMSLGSMVMATAGAYAAAGHITGGGPSDPKLRSYLYNQGWQPYSIKIGDTYYAYGRLEPLGMMMGMAADFVEVSGELGTVESEKLAAHIVAAFSKNVMSKTFLRGLSETVSAFDDPERYGERYIQRLAGTVVPTGAAQIERQLSPEMSDVRTVMDQIRSRVPGYSDAVPVRRNLWGEPIVLSGGLGPDMVSPIYTSKKRQSPIDAELFRLGRATGRAPVGMPRREVSVMGVGVSFDGLKPGAYGEFLEDMNAVRLPLYGDKNLKETLNHLVTKDPAYKTLNDEQKTDLVRGIVRLARQATVQQWYEQNHHRLGDIVNLEIAGRQQAAAGF